MARAKRLVCGVRLRYKEQTRDLVGCAYEIEVERVSTDRIILRHFSFKNDEMRIQ